ncbi:type II toxin-antitoxin system VapC family toxin [Protaetiibacter intestinalis]|uniref:type II toxin-antitoxin system VapC family toxin n=1 Tax=Protaetiibacter intestinalis TaxID=2419774 RepID=UPI0013006EFA|nr:type II toxin-antitoxin system VapC family toxin [Protaetiibacter intestinalis]
MIVLDASVLIAHLAGDDAHADAAFAILDTEEELAIHPMTLAECLVGPVAAGREKEALAALGRLGIERHHPSADEPLTLARLRAAHRLRLPDCCVLAAAEASGATLATFDTRLGEVARARGVPVAGV